MSSLLPFLAIGVIAGLWYVNSRARELAVVLARNACKQRGLQLLDETVALNRIKIERGDSGRMEWRRNYNFEFTVVGNDRLRGTLVLRGKRVIHIHFPDNMPTELEPTAEAIQPVSSDCPRQRTNSAPNCCNN